SVRSVLTAPRALPSSHAPLRSPRRSAVARLSSEGDQHAGGSLVGELVRDIAKPLALISVHALAANNHDRRVPDPRRSEKQISGMIVLDRVPNRGNALVSRFGSGSRDRRFSRVEQL